MRPIPIVAAACEADLGDVVDDDKAGAARDQKGHELHPEGRVQHRAALRVVFWAELGRVPLRVVFLLLPRVWRRGLLRREQWLG
jgi:hypothetical protein